MEQDNENPDASDNNIEEYIVIDEAKTKEVDLMGFLENIPALGCDPRENKVNYFNVRGSQKDIALFDK